MPISQTFPAFPITVPAQRQYPVVLSVQAVTFGGSPPSLVMDVSTGSTFVVALHEDITDWVIVNPTDGQEITVIWEQDSTGGWAVTPASNLTGGIFVTPLAGANAVSAQKFVYEAGAAAWSGM